jgi:competence protein ComGA
MITKITKIIYLFSEEFKGVYSEEKMSQMNVYPIHEINNIKYFFAKEYNKVYEQEIQGQLVVLGDAFHSIQTYPITSYLMNALSLNATDMHITPTNVIYKKQKKHVKNQTINYEEFIRIYNFLKIFCHLNIIKNQDESGVLYVNYIGEIIGVRVSFFESINSLYTTSHSLISFRFLYKTNSKFLLKHEKISWLMHNICKPGLIVIGGATGVGKTTFLYELLETLLNKEKITIISAEDPVERIIEGVFQREVNDNYETIIKSILRHSPDLIVIGEIRDKISASMCVRAVLTGHGVVCTLHLNINNSIENFFSRFLELGVEAKYLQNSIKGFVELLENYKVNIIPYNFTNRE